MAVAAWFKFGRNDDVENIRTYKKIIGDEVDIIISNYPVAAKKYRDSLRQRVGVKQLHYGIYDDPRYYESIRHGITTKSSDHVPDVIKGLNLDGNNAFMNELAESHYASNKREPLGKSIVRNYKFPEVVKSADFKFGIPTSGFLNAKNLIYYGAKEEPGFLYMMLTMGISFKRLNSHILL